MPTPRVAFLCYLAGPISGLTYTEGQDWRTEFAAMVPEEVLCLSPLRSKAHLAAEGVLTGSYENHPLSTARGLSTRDRNDVSRSDMLVVNLLGAMSVSIGTCLEIGMADILRKPLVLIMEREGNIHEHPMIADATGFRVETLDQAAMVVRSVLLPDGLGTHREILPVGV